MAIKDYSATPASNTAINGTGITGANLPSNFDNALREILSDLAKMNAGTEPLQSSLKIEDVTTSTKQITFDVSGVSAATTRTITVPDANVTLIDTTNISSNSSGNLDVVTINGGPFSGFRNRLMNPNFTVDLEGNAGGTTDAAGHAVEGWIVGQGGSDVTTFTFSRIDGDQEKYGLELEVTTGNDPVIDVGVRPRIITAIEGRDIADFQFGTADAKDIYFTIRVKAPTTGVYGLSFVNDDNTRSYVEELNITTANTWEDFQVQIPGDTTGTWASGTSVGMKINVTMACGSTYQTTAGAWQTGLYHSTSSQANGTATNGNVLAIEAVTFSEGGFIPVEHRPYGLDEAQCLRYYQNLAANAFAGGCRGTTEVQVTASYVQRMATNPTVTLLDTSPTFVEGSATRTGSSSTIAASDARNTAVRLRIDGFTSLTNANAVCGSGTTMVSLDARLI